VVLSVEGRLQRRRHWMGVLIIAMIGAIAWADAQVWPGLSLAFGYAVPIASPTRPSAVSRRARVVVLGQRRDGGFAREDGHER